MPSRGRQSDHSVTIAALRFRKWRFALRTIAPRRLRAPASIYGSTTALLFCVKGYAAQRKEYSRYIQRSNRISLSEFSFNFNSLTDSCCLSLFRFTKKDIGRLVTAVGWVGFLTERNRYSCSPLLVACVILRRLTTPSRWRDLEFLFGRHGAQLSEIFWEGVEQMLEDRCDLITGPINSSFLANRAHIYAAAIKDKCHALSNCIGFIDGTVIAIARPSRNAVQNVAYNGHKRKHALKYQAVTTPDGLILHAAGPIEGRRHDWTLYCRSGLDEVLEELMFVDGVQYCLYGDSGYNERSFLEVPFQGSQLTGYQKAFNKAMSTGRVTVEWFFKEVKLYWSTMDYRRKMRTGESPVGALYLVTMLLTNFRNCVYPNTIAQFFLCSPPSLEDYLVHKDTPVLEQVDEE